MVNFPDAHFPLQRQVEGMPANPIDAEDVTGTLPFVGADSERLRTYTANYYNSMNRLDESVGMLLKKLDESGKRKRKYKSEPDSRDTRLLFERRQERCSARIIKSKHRLRMGRRIQQ